MQTKNNEKIFLVFNNDCFGDILLCNSLCQNIKNIFPNSKIIFIICDKKWYEVAKYQKDVDEVFVFDKKGEHKGLLGQIKFCKTFKYKNIYATFITHKNDRNYITSLLLRSKHIFINKLK